MFENKYFKVLEGYKAGVNIIEEKKNNVYVICMELQKTQKLEEYIYDMKKDVGERSVKSLCIMKGDIETISGQNCYNILKELFEGSDVRIIICTGVLGYAKISDRDRICDEFHNSVVGGHRGVELGDIVE